MLFLKKLTRLLEVQMMIRECNQLIQQKHAYETGRDLVSKKEENKCDKKIKRYKND